MSDSTPPSPRSAFLDTGAARIHYLDWAQPDKPPLLIVHGNTHAGGVYAPLAQALSADFRVVALDLRGHGLSSRATDYGWPAMRDDVTALIDHLDLHNLLVVAHSRGGGVAMLATLARRARVRGLLLYEPTVPLRLIRPDMTPDGERAWAEARLARSQGRRSAFASRAEAHAHYQGRGSFMHWRDDYLRAFVQHGVVESAGGGAELASHPDTESQLVMTRPDMQAWAALTPSELPTLAVYGQDSGRIGNLHNDSREAVRALFPRTRIHILPGATHSGPMEQPEAFEALVRGLAAQATPAQP